MKKYQIKIKALYGDDTDRKTAVIARPDETDESRIDRAIEKMYGKNCFWWADNGLPGYGQVCRPIGNNTNDCLTKRVRLDVTAIAKN